MNGKEIRVVVTNYIVRPLAVGALIFLLVKMESCRNSQDEQARNQAIELTKDDLQTKGLLNTISGEIKHLLGRDNKSGVFGSK